MPQNVLTSTMHRSIGLVWHRRLIQCHINALTDSGSQAIKPFRQLTCPNFSNFTQAPSLAFVELCAPSEVTNLANVEALAF